MNGDDYFQAYETHSAVILLVGDRAVKFKKPVNLGFLDFSTLERRRWFCEREVELNRRIAPDVYQGVAQVTDPDGQVREYLVVMRRMPARLRLSTLVTAGEPVETDLRQIARKVAAFHASAERGAAIAAEGTRDAIRRRWTDSFTQMHALADPVLPAGMLDEIESLTYEFLDGRFDLFDARVAGGRIVDGHGDLLTADIYCLEDGPRILDCIEFDDKLRWLDQLDDAAFLAMDLEYLGVPDLARRYLDWYVEFAGDPAPMALRHHFLAYRAFVRCKVACLRCAQGDEDAREEARRHGQLTLDHLRAGTVSLILVGGLPGTGKTTLGGALADALGAVLVSTDRVRKELAAQSPASSAAAGYGQGLYSPEWTERVYREVLHRAEELLGRGESVVLDASWSSQRHREMARAVGERTRSRVAELCCQAPQDVAVHRLRTRTGSMSDADEAIRAAMAAHADPWPTSAAIDTGASLRRGVSQAVAAICARTGSEPALVTRGA